MLIQSEDYRTAEVIRIENEELIQDLGLEPHRPGLRYAVDEMDEQRLTAIEDEYADLDVLSRDKQAVLTPYQHPRWFPSRIPYRVSVNGGPYSLIKTEVQLKESEQEMGAQLPPILQDVSADGGEYFVLMQKALTAYAEGESLTFNGTVAQMHQLASEMDIPNFNRRKSDRSILQRRGALSACLGAVDRRLSTGRGEVGWDGANLCGGPRSGRWFSHFR